MSLQKCRHKFKKNLKALIKEDMVKIITGTKRLIYIITPGHFYLFFLTLRTVHSCSNKIQNPYYNVCALKLKGLEVFSVCLYSKTEIF